MLTLKQVDDVIKEVFDDTKVKSVDSVYEKADGFYKLVISLHGLTFEDTIIAHTKLIFKTNIDKTVLIENSLYYLYDIKCVYKAISFNDSDDLRDKLIGIINSNMFGKDIQGLSEFMLQSASRINSYLSERGVETFSVYTVEYEPKFKMVPCENMKFDFVINVNDQHEFTLNIDKNIDDNIYKMTFKYIDNIEVVDVESLVNIAPIIAEQLMKMLENKV